MTSRSIWVGYDPKELDAYLVAKESARRHMRINIPIRPIILSELEEIGWYKREWTECGGLMRDTISDAPMSTQFAISRFLTTHLAVTGYALYVDCDVLFRCDPGELFDLMDPSFAVMCVKHEHIVNENRRKMEERIQVNYPRKNWSSVVIYNCEHPVNKKLTLDLINRAPGRDLHRFCWLDDDDIGSLPLAWNHLVGVTEGGHPKLVHFTSGTPSMKGYDAQPFVDEWRGHLMNAIKR